MMNNLKKIKLFKVLVRVKIFKERVPLFVSWIITNRCNYACAYCNPPRTHSGELSTGEVCKVVEELAPLGTKKISFTGGEPLLREDLGEIIRFCGVRGIATSVNSNGSLVPARIRDLLGVDALHLSLDGPEKVHDQVRGEGSFDDVMKAANIAKEHGLNISFSVTLSKLNLEYLDFFLQVAKTYKSLVWFQPSEIHVLRGEGLNPLVQPQDPYKEFMTKLIEAKKHHRFIGNSISGLGHLSRWPDYLSMRCYGGRLFCRIDAKGDVKICGRGKGTVSAGNVLNGGFKKAFDNIRLVTCDSCWVANRVEFNYALAGDLWALCSCVRSG